jgi:hypothetical protein
MVGARQIGDGPRGSDLLGCFAEVFIETGERTVLQYLAGPLTDMIAHSWREQ